MLGLFKGYRPKRIGSRFARIGFTFLWQICYPISASSPSLHLGVISVCYPIAAKLLLSGKQLVYQRDIGFCNSVLREFA